MAWQGLQLKMSITSSAYTSTLTGDAAACTCCMIGDMRRDKRSGDKGQPCLTPELGRKSWPWQMPAGKIRRTSA